MAGMITYEAACQLVDSTAADSRLPVEKISLWDGFLRVVAENQISKLDLPPFNKSAMDGYAILKNDQRDSYRLIEVVAAGKVPQSKLTPGTTIQVMTGAPVPKNTDKVIPIENTKMQEENIYIETQSTVRHICNQGEDVKIGDTILKKASVLGSIEIANLISCGITEVTVYKKPRIAIISTGDEIVDSFDHLSSGKIMNSNGPLLQILCQRNEWEVVMNESIHDDIIQTKLKIEEALSKADVLICTGGVSMGSFDYVLSAIQNLNLVLHFNRVAIKPGKPTVFASIKDKFIFGLPGNPVAVYITFHLFVKRLVARLTGSQKQDEKFMFPLACDVKRKSTDRLEFVACKLSSHGKLLPVVSHGSAHLLALLQADGFFIFPHGQSILLENTSVQFLKWI